jgi:four helix bundle protein
MGTIKNFEDLEVWCKARLLCKEIYEVTLKGSFAKDYSLKNQILDSSGSIMDNIAEGFEREGVKEFIQFLSIAKGSVGETRSQLYRVFDRNHIEKEIFEKLFSDAIQISKMLSGFINYLKNSELKGSKYKVNLRT